MVSYFVVFSVLPGYVLPVIIFKNKVFLRQATSMPEPKAEKSKYLFLFLRVLVVSVGIVWAGIWLSREQRWSNLVSIFARMKHLEVLGAFILALSVFLLCLVIISFRWWLLLRTQSVFIGFLAAVRLNFLGWFYNNFMPGSVGGDLLRAWYVTKHTDKRFEAALSVFVDRAIGLLSTLIIALFFYVFFLRGRCDSLTLTGDGRSLEFFSKYRLVIIWVVVVFVGVVCVLSLHGRGRLWVQKIALGIKVRGLRVIEKFKNAAHIYCRNPLVILTVFGLTVFLQIIQITGFWLLGTHLGITVSIKYYYVFFTLSWVLGALPVSIAGAVVVEGMLAYFFVHFAGVEPEAALALALCQRIVWMIASLPGAVIHLIGAHLPAEPENKSL
jgi:uncharacterized protein (TIRG00374 family)